MADLSDNDNVDTSNQINVPNTSDADVIPAPLHLLNKFFANMDKYELTTEMLNDYNKLVHMFQQELVDRGLRPDFIDRMLTLHMYPHEARLENRSGPSLRNYSESSQPLLSAESHSRNVQFFPVTTTSSNLQNFDSIMGNLRRLNESVAVATSNISNVVSTTASSQFQNPHYRALHAANSMLARLQNEVREAIEVTDDAIPNIPPTSRQQAFAMIYNTVFDELNTMISSCAVSNVATTNSSSIPNVPSNPIFTASNLSSMYVQPTASSMSNNFVNSLPVMSSYSPCSGYYTANPPNYVNPLFNSNVVNPPCNSNVVNPLCNPNVVNPNVNPVFNLPVTMYVSNPSVVTNFLANPPMLPYNSVMPTFSNPLIQQSTLTNIDKLIPKFTSPYYLWAAQVRKLLYSRGYHDLRNPNLMLTIGSAILNRLPSNAALAAPTVDVESLLQFLEGYDRHRRDVFEVMGKDGKFNNKPSIHFFLKCAEIRQADHANLSDYQVQMFAWQSMQKLFPIDMKSYIAIVSQGNRLPTQDQWETIDKMWSEALVVKKGGDSRSGAAASVQQTQGNEPDPITKLTAQLEKAFNVITQQNKQQSSMFIKDVKKSVDSSKVDSSNKLFKKIPDVGVTLQERGVNMKKYEQARFPHRKDLCFFHQVFGPAATRCKENGCKWEENGKRFASLRKKNDDKTSTSETKNV